MRLSKPRATGSPQHPRMMSAKLKALQLVRNKGPLERSDPNNPIQKPTTPQMQAKVMKRALNTSADDTAETGGDGGAIHTDTPRPSKRSKAELDGLLEAKSSHANLIDEFENQQSEMYFNKLERKEQMETKMLDTFEIKTTAVTCSKVRFFFLLILWLGVDFNYVTFRSAIIQLYRLLNCVDEKVTKFVQSKPLSAFSNARIASKGPSPWIAFLNVLALTVVVQTGRKQRWQRSVPFKQNKPESFIYLIKNCIFRREKVQFCLQKSFYCAEKNEKILTVERQVQES